MNYLVGAEHSLYTGKARAYLRYKNVPHEMIQGMPEMFLKVILPQCGWAVVPVVIEAENGKVIQDTCLIIDHFESKNPGFRSVIPTSPKQRAVSEIMGLFGDEFLTVAAMHYRWSFPEQLDFLRHEWGRMNNPEIHAHGSLEERQKMGKTIEAMMKRFSGFTPILGVSEKTIPGIEQSYFRFLMNFENHLQSHRNLLGHGASVGDFGLFGPLYAHLLRDPVPGMLLKTKAPHVAEWVERLNGNCFLGDEQDFQVELVEGSDDRYTVVKSDRKTDFLDGDQVPETLEPLLQQFFDEHVPLLLETVQALRDYLKNLPREKLGDELPRGVGIAPFEIGGCEGTKMLHPFHVWKLQRVLDSLTPESRDYLAKFGPNAQLFLSDSLLSGMRLTKRKGQGGSTIYLDLHESKL